MYMKRIIITLFILMVPVVMVSAEDGLITLKSHYDVKTTGDRLVAALNAKDMTVFIRIDHSEGARKAGLDLRPTELVIFGNPKVGTPFMQCGQTVAIDLPQKALIWQDKDGTVWLSYNDPAYLARRHGITGCEDVIQKMKGALSNFAHAAVSE